MGLHPCQVSHILTDERVYAAYPFLKPPASLNIFFFFLRDRYGCCCMWGVILQTCARHVLSLSISRNLDSAYT